MNNREAFEAWANTHGGLDLTTHEAMDNEKLPFPCTYYSYTTEIAWRAFANKKEPSQAALASQAQQPTNFIEGLQALLRINPNYEAVAAYVDAFQPTSQAQQGSKELGHPYGIVDPDYARIYTQSRIIAWQYGYSCLMHGSFTRDLDLLLVPWEESARDNHDQLLKLIADACGLQFKDGEKEIYKAKVDWTNKPHGRKSCSLFFKEARDRRWIDIAVLPVSPPAPEGE